MQLAKQQSAIKHENSSKTNKKIDKLEWQFKKIIIYSKLISTIIEHKIKTENKKI